jgi:hypothetical protein
MNCTEFMEHQFYYCVPIYSYLEWADFIHEKHGSFYFCPAMNVSFKIFPLFCVLFFWMTMLGQVAFHSSLGTFFPIMLFESTATECSLFNTRCFSQALNSQQWWGNGYVGWVHCASQHIIFLCFRTQWRLLCITYITKYLNSINYFMIKQNTSCGKHNSHTKVSGKNNGVHRTKTSKHHWKQKDYEWCQTTVWYLLF